MLGLITDNLATIIIGLILLGIILLVVRSMRRDKSREILRQLRGRLRRVLGRIDMSFG